jgi:hypothetical protein
LVTLAVECQVSSKARYVKCGPGVDSEYRLQVVLYTAIMVTTLQTAIS